MERCPGFCTPRPQSTLALQKSIIRNHLEPEVHRVGGRRCTVTTDMDKRAMSATRGKQESGSACPIFAVIGVLVDGDKTYYVKRSAKIDNYPLVWSLLSTQFTPDELPDHFDLSRAEAIMERMSAERLGGANVRVTRYLSSATCADNPMHRRVFLHMYQIAISEQPVLDPEY